MTKAIVEIGGFQYSVSKGNRITVPFMALKEGERINIDKVLMVIDGEDIRIGKPYVSGAKVEAEVLKNYRGKKIIVFKMKRRKNYRRKKGYRSELTDLVIKDIQLDRK